MNVAQHNVAWGWPVVLERETTHCYIKLASLHTKTANTSDRTYCGKPPAELLSYGVAFNLLLNALSHSTRPRCKLLRLAEIHNIVQVAASWRTHNYNYNDGSYALFTGNQWYCGNHVPMLLRPWAIVVQTLCKHLRVVAGLWRQSAST